MTPEQAYALLFEATEPLHINRTKHLQILQALEVIKQLVIKSKDGAPS